MPAVACPFVLDRIDLTADVITPIVAPRTLSSVTVGNPTAGDLKVGTDVGMVGYTTIPAGFERQFNCSQSGSAAALFQKGTIAFWVSCTVSDTIVVQWS